MLITPDHFILQIPTTIQENAPAPPAAPNDLPPPCLINSMPADIMISIFWYLDPEVICLIARVCKVWNHRANNFWLWKQLVLEHLPNCVKEESMTWKEFYRGNIYGKLIRDILASKNEVYTCQNLKITAWFKHDQHRDFPYKSIDISTAHTKPITCFEMQICGMAQRIITGSADNTIEVFIKHTPSDTLWIEKNLAGHKGAITVIKACENFIYSGSTDTTIKIWGSDYLKSVTTCIKTITGHRGTVTCLQIGYRNNWGRRIYSGSADKTIRFWNIFNSGNYSCKQTITEHRGAITCLAIDLRNNQLFSGSTDKTIKVWNIGADGSLTPHQTLEVHSCAVTALLKHPAENLLFSGSADTTINVLSKDDDGHWTVANTLSGHKRAITCITTCYHVLGKINKMIYSLSSDNVINLWGTSGDKLRYQRVYTMDTPKIE